VNVLSLTSTTGLGDPGVSHGLLFGASSSAVALVLVWLPVLQLYACVLTTDVPFGGDIGSAEVSWPVLSPGTVTEIVPAPNLGDAVLSWPMLDAVEVE
jgi:hypothetical protein